MPHGVAVIDLVVIFMEDREREMEKMRGDGVDAQTLSEADLLVACPTVSCFGFREKTFCMIYDLQFSGVGLCDDSGVCSECSYGR